ncbi:hypothetical protein AX17_003889 [Amanita inopinata Kibby_2008]|nr:hypothetical protein AX17_003889 [Amanita inopinata Kibby_2008]
MSCKRDSRQVNNLLHTLRGEQFRREQNAKGSRTHLASTSLFSHNSGSSNSRSLPSLPKDLFKLDYNDDPTRSLASLRLEPDSPHRASPLKCSGPKPPKSWRRSAERDVCETQEWRAEALSLIFSHLPDTARIPLCHTQRSQTKTKGWVPPLTLICLRHLLDLTSTYEFTHVIVPHLPIHLRRDLVRDTAIYSPLSDAKLYSLCGKDGHVGGELIVVGPAASLPEGYFLRNTISGRHGDALAERQSPTYDDGDDAQLDDWDADQHTPELLQTLVLVSTRLAPSTLLSLPATITHMSLIHLPVPIPLHRLPTVCPLLELLDLSHNAWLSDEAQDAAKLLDRVDWGRWSYLRILGFRGCCIPKGMLDKLNRGRWDDVQIVQ